MPRHPLTTPLALALALAGGMSAAPSSVFAKADNAITSETYARAENFFRDGKFRDASIELKNVLRANPDHAPARLMLGKIALQGGELKTAEKEIGRAHRLAPNDETAILLGEIALQQSKPDEALALVTGDAENDDLLMQKLIIRGAALINLERLDEAETAFRDVVAIDSRRVEGHFGLARVFAARKDYSRAVDKLDKIVQGKPDYAPGWILRGEVSLTLGDKHAAFLSFDKAVALQPNNIGPLISRARASLSNGDITRARSDAVAVARLEPSAPISHYLKAAIAFAEGDYDTANNSFTQLQRSFDRFSPAVLLGALIKTEREEYNQADSLFQRYISMEPNNLDAKRALATVRLRMGQPSNAVDILENLLERSPEDTGTRRQLAGAYLALDRFDDAREHFAILAETGTPVERRNAATALTLLDPSTGGDNTLRLAVLKAGAALSNNDPTAAEAVLDTLSESVQQAARVQALRGGIAAARGDIETARTSFERALAADPELVAAHVAQEQLDPTPRVTTERLRSMAASNPDSEFLLMRLSQQLAQTGEREAALTVLENGVGRLPNSTEVMKALVSNAILLNRNDVAIREAKRLSAMPEASLNDLSFAVVSLIDAGAGQDAVSAADRLAKRAPDSPRASLIRADALAAADRIDDAYATLRAGLRRWPGNASVAGTMATLAIEQRNTAVAQEAAQSLSKHNPGAAARLLAHAAAEMGQPVVGVQVLEKAFSRNPDGQLATALYGARIRAGRTDAANKGPA